MANYTFRFFVSTGGIAAPGLTPVWDSCYNGSDVALTGVNRPTIAALASDGWYEFTVDLTATGGVYGQIDCSNSIPNPYERYVRVNLCNDPWATMATIASDIAFVRDYFDHAAQWPIRSGTQTFTDRSGVVHSWTLLNNNTTVTRTPA